MIPISQAARRFGLSRSTLLHYDHIGLVSPSYRTAAGYRLYQEEDLGRLELVCRYREAGLPLARIHQLLDPSRPEKKGLRKALRRRLNDINTEIAGLRRQQQVTLRLLGDEKDGEGASRIMTKDKWVAMLRDVGMSEKEMQAWHRSFEARNPEAHQDFLESLGIDQVEIARIRAHSKAASAKGA